MVDLVGNYVLSLAILNLVIIIGMFTLTIYRVWIEKKQLTAQDKIKIIKATLEREKETIKELSGEEFLDMLNTILED